MPVRLLKLPVTHITVHLIHLPWTIIIISLFALIVILLSPYQNSPELPEMLEEFRDKLSEAREPLFSLLTLGREKGTFSNTGHSYIEAKYKLNMLYCLNIA